MGHGIGAAVGGFAAAVAAIALSPFTGGVSTALFVAAATAAGSYAGGQIDMALTAPVQGPRLGDVQVSTSTQGLPIPRGWGVYRLPGQLIWTGGIEENSTEESGKKGKGLKGPGAVTYNYTASFAMAFALGPADRILRILADGKPVYDISDSSLSGGIDTNEEILALISHNAAGNVAFPFRFYGGDEAQLPDPLIAEAVGAARCPAFRGLCYIVVESATLIPYGNRIPNISAEIAFSGAGGALATTLQEGASNALPTGYIYQQSTGAYDGVRGIIYRRGFDVATGADDLLIVSYGLPMETERTASVSDLYAGSGFTFPATGAGTLTIQSLAASDGSMLYMLIAQRLAWGNVLVAVDPLTLKVVAQWGVTQAGVSVTTSYLNTLIGGIPDTFKVARVLTAEGVRDMLALTSSLHRAPMVFSGCLATLAGPQQAQISYVYGAVDDVPLTTEYEGGFGHGALIEGKRALGTTDLWLLNWYNLGAYGPTVEGYLLILAPGSVLPSHPWSLTFAEAGFGAADGSGMYLWECQYDRANDALIMHLASDGTVGGGTVFTWRVVSVARSGAVRWSTVVIAGHTTFAGLMGNGRLLGTTYSFSAVVRIYTLDTRTGAILDNVSTASIGYNYPDGTSATPATPLYNEAFDSITGFLWNQGATAYNRYYLGVGSGTGVALSDVVSDICTDCGLTAGDFDVTQLSSDVVRGFLATVAAGRESIQSLAAAYLFDVVESDDKLKFVKRGGDAARVVPYAKVLAGEDGRGLRPTREQPFNLPRAVTVRYPDPSNSYQQGAQAWSRVTAPASVKVVDALTEGALDVPLVLTADEARSIAKRTALMAWAERETYSAVGLPPEFVALEPTDVIELGLADGESLARVRLSRVDVGADYTVQISGTVEDETLIAVTAPGDAGDPFRIPALPAPYAVQPEIFDLPLLEDADDTSGLALRVYLGGAAYPGQTFGGATYLVSASAAADFTTLGTVSRESPGGVALSVLGDVADPGVTDTANTLEVLMHSGAASLTTATREQVLNGANVAVLVNPSGEAEVFQFEEVEALGGSKYRLSRLYRGRRGTDWATAGHTLSDRFMLATSSLKEASIPSAALNAPRYVKTLGLFDLPDASNAYPVTWRGTAERPYSPVGLEGARDGSSNLTATWIRRSRLGGEWSDDTEAVPIGEEAELYDAEILSGGGAVLRTFASLTAATLTYTAAEQVTDGLTPGDPVAVRVYQRSALVGRGYGRTATV